jgi:hypothetical protein
MSSSGRCVIEALETRCLFAATAAAAAADALPTVSVTARGAAAYETDTVTRFFYIRRSGDLSQPLSVFYTVGGKAKQGLDYNPIGDGITIKPGTHLRRIEVTPVDDGFDERNESITLTLNARDTYTIDPARPAATIRIISSENTPLPPPPSPPPPVQ